MGRNQKGGELGRGTGEKPAAATTSSTPLHEVIYSSLPEAPNTTSSTLFCRFCSSIPSPSQFYTFCLSLYPRRPTGQAVFTAEVIGVVGESLTLALLRPKICVCVYPHVCIRLFVMTGSEARKGKQALANVSPLGRRQIGFHYAVCLFLSHILKLSLSSPRISLHLTTNSKTIIHAFSCTSLQRFFSSW